MKKWCLGILAGVLVTAIVVAVILIAGNKENFEPKLEIVANKSLEMYVDDAPQKLTYTVDCNEDYLIEFVCSSNVVSISENGYVTANIQGCCTVEIKVSSTSLTKSAYVSVVVKKRENTFVPTLELTVQDTLVLCNDDAPIKLNYSVSCNEKYSIEFEISSDIVSVDSQGNVTPNKVGSCIILIMANSISGLKQEKEVAVIVNPSQMSAGLKIMDSDGTIPQNIFVSKEYMLEITCSKKLVYNPKIEASQNVSNCTLKERQEQKLIYSFQVTNHGIISFNFSYKDYTTTITKQAYLYVSNIDASFSREIENMQILLYLFNENYENTANLSNFYQNIQFSILDQANVLNEYSVVVTGDNVMCESYSNTHTLLAKTTGESQLKIYANDGSGYFISYTVIVQEIHISDIHFTQENVSLDIGEKYEYEVKYSPTYALTNLTYYLNNEIYIGATLQFSNSGTNTFKVVDSLSNLEATLTLTVTQKENPFTILWDTNFMKNNTTSFENDTLSITTTQENIDIPFSYQIQGVTSIKCDMYYTLDGLTLSDQAIEDNTVTLTLQGKGLITLTLTSQENPSLSYTLTIVVF